MLRKIITYFLLLAVILPVFALAIPSPSGGLVWGVKISHAGTHIKKTDEQKLAETKLEQQERQSAEVNGMCDIFWGKGTFAGCAMWLFVDWFLYKVVLKLSVLTASIAGTMFNISIGFSLTGSIFDADKNLMIKNGWTYVRDLLNLVFIFILLYAAISTILQYGNVDIKKILPSLIVAALLVNFSLMISKMVIDASHVLAWEFYNQIDVVNTKIMGDKKISTANIEDEIKVSEIYGAFEKKNLANVFLAGFNPQKMLTGDTANSSAFATAMKDAQDKKDKVGIFSLMTQMMIILVLQSVLALFGGFILLAGAIMFVLRVVVLWLVMIFSPLAFLGMILPSMEKYSKMWWGYLIGQSFFAPAFLFMFMLVTIFINGNFIDSIVEVTANSNLKIAFGLNAAVMVIPIFHFMIVGGLMMACLIVARQIGGKTAEFGISWAHKGKEMALGAAKFGINNRGTRYLGGKVGDSNWFAKSIGRIPGGNILGRKLGAMKKADEDKGKKTAEKYAGTLSSAGRTSLEGDIEGTKGVAGFAKRFIYTGPEGAPKSGKEGYEKIIEKKKGEEDERKRIATKAVELMGSHVTDFMDIEIGDEDEEDVIRQKTKDVTEDAKEKAKGILLRGNMEELDKYVEMEDKKVEEKSKEEKNKIIENKRELNVKIKGAEFTLNKVREQHGNINLAEREYLELTKKLDKYEKDLAEIVVKEKHRENLQKTVDKYESKQNVKSGKPEEKKEKKEKETKSK